MKLILILVPFLCLTLTDAIAQQIPAPGSINLLPGYQHVPSQGIDSKTGVIFKQGGLRIHYDIGETAGTYVDCSWCGWTQDEIWRKKQSVNGQEVVCVFTKKNRLIVSFPKSHANFYATIKNQDQQADMLLMVLTYHAAEKQNE